jgi:DHA1 family inner membrane transport protein
MFSGLTLATLAGVPIGAGIGLAFNLGNALGAAAGGTVIAAGWGLAALPPVGAAITVLGLGLAAASLAAPAHRVAPQPAE